MKNNNQELKRSNLLFRSLVGKSEAMLKVQNEIKQVATSDANVLILGESGTGKEVVARNIHYFSNRNKNNFVPINCGAIPPDLLESELFGHEKGAFTGAISSRPGRFSMADGGTLFLDEIGEMTMAMQVKLLRVLEERVFERVGGTTTIKADVRIIAATNRNLEEMVKQGDFREDLYFRLDVFPIQLPALRQRIDDLPLLIKELITRLESTKNSSVRFTKSAIIALSRHNWPGNIRELANLIERMSIRFPNAVVGEDQLPEKIKACALNENIGLKLEDLDDRSVQALCNAPDTVHTSQVNIPTEGFNLKKYISDIEIKIIQDALDNTDGVISHAAKTLGLRRTTLAEKMRKYHIEKNQEQLHISAC
ncbi:MAG: sigma-54-dependent Fis family transcriptional regulator [Thiotrichaceae bacterium]|nr:MAG: sigma-54-dependent Fis family transcriptional regulator [Thiotrichaceae bacterium]